MHIRNTKRHQTDTRLKSSEENRRGPKRTKEDQTGPKRSGEDKYQMNHNILILNSSNLCYTTNHADTTQRQSRTKQDQLKDHCKETKSGHHIVSGFLTRFPSDCSGSASSTLSSPGSTPQQTKCCLCQLGPPVERVE